MAPPPWVSAAAAAVLEDIGLVSWIAPFLVETVVLASHRRNVHVRASLPVLLSLTRHSRAACLSALYTTGLLHLQAGPVRYTVLHRPTKTKEGVSLPFQWSVVLHTPVFERGPIVVGIVHPFHELWQCTHRSLCDRCSPQTESWIDVVVCLHRDDNAFKFLSDADRVVLMTETSTMTMPFLALPPTPDLGLEFLRDDLEVFESLEHLFAVSIHPCFGLLERVAKATREYQRWSRVRGARRLGLQILPSEEKKNQDTTAGSCGVTPRESA